MYACFFQKLIGVKTPTIRTKTPSINLKNCLKLHGKKLPEFIEYSSNNANNDIEVIMTQGNIGMCFNFQLYLILVQCKNYLKNASLIS